MKKTKKMLSILLCILMIATTFCSALFTANAVTSNVQASGASTNIDKFTNTVITLGVGETYTFSQDLIKNVVSEAEFISYRWGSDNTNIATVNNNGKITAKAVGVTYVSIISNVYNQNAITPKCKVIVKKAPSYVAIDPSSVTLGMGETFVVTKTTSKDSYAGTFTWKSSNNNVATVQQTSFNKAKITTKGTGTAIITLSAYNGKTATCKVTVRNAPKSILIDKPSRYIGLGESVTINYNTNAGSYSNKINWSSTDSSVVSVKQGKKNKAVVTAHKLGSANISVKTYNGVTISYKAIVRNAPSSVTLNKEEVSLFIGDKISISGAVNSGATANTFTWTSSNSSVASVTNSTNCTTTITANKEGTANIKITTYNGKTDICKVNVYKDNKEEYINEVIRLVNIERAKEGLGSLERRKDAEKMANIRAVEISEYFNHTRPNGESWSVLLKELNIPYKTAGENIASGQETPEVVVNGWMNSPGHRKNIMNPNFTGLGVGYYFNPDLYYEHYWVQNFVG